MAVTQSQLTELYLAYFGRPPDYDGLRFYLAHTEFDMTKVAANFSASPESQAMYGTVFGAAQIDAIYQNLFNRNAEPAGVTYWSGEVNAGRISPAGAALAILQGAQNGDKLAVQSKLAVANALLVGFDPHSTANSAFKGFEIFDAKGLAKAFDLDIVAADNTVAEIIASGDVGSGASLLNMGTSVAFRATGSSVNTLTLTQKTAGALAVTVDIDEDPAHAHDGNDTVHSSVVATNATSLSATFDANFVDVADNRAELVLVGSSATTLSVVSGGSRTVNYLQYVAGSDGADVPHGALTRITISGDQNLDVSNLSVAGDVASGLALIDASALTGRLFVDLADLKDGGRVALGAGIDTVTIGTASDLAGIESISGLQKGVDKLKLLAPAAVAVNDEVADAHGATVSNGVVSFAGTGPSTFDEMVSWVDAQVNAGEAAVFQYINDTYLFTDGGVLVRLVGVTGVTELVEAGTTDVFTLN